jgi:hypothetical protein
MKKYLAIALFFAALVTSCDKVENIYPPSTGGTWDLYPNGDSAHYAQNEWPTFAANTNTDRNILIEDYTGHQCNFCPAAAVEAESIESANPGRVFISTIHAGPNGTGTLQELNTAAGYSTIFYNSTTVELGRYFGVNWPGTQFLGNPFGAISRTDNGNGTPMEGPQTWTTSSNSVLAANDLKVNLQAETNYYPSTRGLFVHVEADKIDGSLTNELKLVVQLHQDSLVAPQKMFDQSQNTSYVHHDILRGTLDGRTFGQTLDAEHMDVNGKYYFDYIYELPTEYDSHNMHLVIYVRDAVTEEIYQVIEKHFD